MYLLQHVCRFSARTNRGNDPNTGLSDDRPSPNSAHCGCCVINNIHWAVMRLGRVEATKENIVKVVYEHVTGGNYVRHQ